MTVKEIEAGEVIPLTGLCFCRIKKIRGNQL